MAKINRADLTKLKIIQVATKKFLESGYSNTSLKAISDELGMSTGNLTFYFPTKEHLLAELTEMLCKFQWQMTTDVVKEGKSSMMAICLELTGMAAMSEEDEIVKDFYLSAYSHPLPLDIIRSNDCVRAKEVFHQYCPDWTDEDFAAAEAVVSGIEYATLMTTASSANLETRIREALDSMMAVFHVPQEVREAEIEKVLARDYRKLGRESLSAFVEYVSNTTENAMEDIIKSWLGKA